MGERGQCPKLSVSKGDPSHGSTWQVGLQWNNPRITTYILFLARKHPSPILQFFGNSVSYLISFNKFLLSSNYQE